MTTDIDAVRAALAAASPGPREATQGVSRQWWVESRNTATICDQVDAAADALLISHAPEWLAALADEVEALREKLARVETLADDYQHLSPGGFHGADAARELRDALTD